MPTKPITTFTYATDAVFGSGPATGFPTKIIPPSLLQGGIPGTGVTAEAINYLFNVDGDWTTNWVFLGTNAADEDAHIVETDADGLISATRGDFGASTDAALVPSLVVTEKTAGDAPSLGVTFGAGPNRAVFISQSSTTSASSAVLVQNTEGTGDVMSLISGAMNAGRGLVITTQDTNPAPLQLLGRDQPGAPALGDVYVDDTTNEERLRVYHTSQFNSVWTTSEGFARGYAESLAESSSAASGALISKASVTIAATEGLVSGETVHLRGVCEVGSDAADATSCNVGLRDSTGAVDIVAARNVRIFHATGRADERWVVVEADYVLPSSGARTFFLGFEGDGVTAMYIMNASLEITGQY